MTEQSKNVEWGCFARIFARNDRKWNNL